MSTLEVSLKHFIVVTPWFSRVVSRPSKPFPENPISGSFSAEIFLSEISPNGQNKTSLGHEFSVGLFYMLVVFIKSEFVFQNLTRHLVFYLI